MSEKTINTKPKSLFERMGVTYTEGADGLLYPDIVLTEDTPHYGKYGEMRKRYLQQHDHALYSSLSLKGKLVAHLNDIDDTCNERMERMVGNGRGRGCDRGTESQRPDGMGTLHEQHHQPSRRSGLL